MRRRSLFILAFLAGPTYCQLKTCKPANYQKLLWEYISGVPYFCFEDGLCKGYCNGKVVFTGGAATPGSNPAILPQDSTLCDPNASTPCGILLSGTLLDAKATQTTNLAQEMLIQFKGNIGMFRWDYR